MNSIRSFSARKVASIFHSVVCNSSNVVVRPRITSQCKVLRRNFFDNTQIFPASKFPVQRLCKLYVARHFSSIPDSTSINEKNASTSLEPSSGGVKVSATRNKKRINLNEDQKEMIVEKAPYLDTGFFLPFLSF